MHGRWRLFRHDAGRRSGPPPWVYVALFAASLLLGLWSAEKFDAIVIWPGNGVLLAAVLQLRRRQAIGVLLTCLAINLANNIVRGDPMPFLWLNAVMNFVQVGAAGLIARRVCGAALDLRRPRRLANFALLAVTPAVLLSAAVLLGVVQAIHHYSLAKLLFTIFRYFNMEALGLLIVAPALLLIAKSHRFHHAAPAKRLETTVLLGLLAAVTGAIFLQSSVPLAFVIFPLLAVVAFRLSPCWVAGAVIMVATIGGTATVAGIGPAGLMTLAIPGLEAVPVLFIHLNLYYLFMLMVTLTALPISAVMSSRRRLIQRLEGRTAAAQAARRRAEQADAAKSRFLALMSHEMRTPLNSVAGYAEVLSRRTDLAPEIRDHLGQIQRSGDALLMLVEDVLEVSRGDDTVTPEPFSLAEVLAISAGPSRILAEDKGVVVTIEVRPAAAAPVYGDRRRLRQALHHLIDNAVKFTERGGRVSVVADRIAGDLLIAVTDSGCGLDPARAPSLFEPFVQGDDSISRCHVGAGVGLALVRRNARLMGGDVIVNSRPGDGATFTLHIPAPLADAAAEGLALALHPVPAAAEPEGRPPRVLVVDDHAANREVARLMLTAVGCEVAEAADGDEAIVMAEAQTFDLILMDVRMPRVDGLAATRAIRALPGPAARVPILAVTADAMPEDAARCIAAGMDAHLAKPISHHALYAAMDKLLSAAESAEIVAA